DHHFHLELASREGVAEARHARAPLGHGGMVFTHSTDCTLLFSWWHPTTLPQYLLSLLAFFCICLVSEWLGAHSRARLPAERSPLVFSKRTASATTSLYPTLQPLLLDCCSIGTSYASMLLAMSFNIGVFVTVILGLAIGRACFGHSQDGVQVQSDAEFCR
ncbi:MAG: hypothetical protein SGPRY_012931, partial [Prymnesium sp.]